MSGGDVDITVTINAPSGKEKLYEIRQTEINNEIEIDESGPFEICFDNSFSTFSEKVIYFDLGIDEHNKTGLDHAEMFDGLVLQKDTYEHTSELLVSVFFVVWNFLKVFVDFIYTNCKEFQIYFDDFIRDYRQLLVL